MTEVALEAAPGGRVSNLEMDEVGILSTARNSRQTHRR